MVRYQLAVSGWSFRLASARQPTTNGQPSADRRRICSKKGQGRGKISQPYRMSEPRRATDTADGTPVGIDDRDRSSRIEQLLLAGLDQYFSGRYEEAIDIWTRVAFLERRNGRARAYIERARSALAERQRESEELLHQGIAAYQAGDLQRARDLLTRAVEP